MGAFEEFVAAQWRPLLPTAALLTGSDAAAADLVGRGLAAARPAWRALPGDADAQAQRAAALQGLVRAHLSRWRRLVRGDGSVTGAAPDAWWTSPAEAEAARRLSAALDRLTPLQRTAVVLHHHEGLAVEQVAALLRVADVVPLLARAAAELADEVGDPADLPARLDGLAAQTDASALDDDRAVAGVRAVRASRRRRAALGVAVVGVLVAGGALVPDLPGTTAAAPASLTAPEQVEVVEQFEEFTPWPELTPADLDAAFGTTPRGSLAGDQEFGAALLAISRESVTGYPVVDGRRVVYAGDLAGSRYALVTGVSCPDVVHQWFRGPAGTAAADLDMFMTGYQPIGSSTAVVDAGVSGAVFLGIAAPGDRIEVSPGIDVRPDGTAGRDWLPAPETDGIAVLPLTSSLAWAQYRVFRGDVVVETTAVSSPAGFGVDGGRPVVLSDDPLRPSPAAAAPFAYLRALRSLTEPTGLDPAVLDVTLLWAGPIPTADGRTADALVLAAVFPSGAVVTTTAFEDLPGLTTGGPGSCGSRGHPAGTDPATLVVVARCEVIGGLDVRAVSSIVVTAPPGTASVPLGPGIDGAPLEVPLTDGWAVLGDVGPRLGEVTSGPGAGPISTEGRDDLFAW